MKKRAIGVEAFLSWAYVEELPKAGRDPVVIAMGGGGGGGMAGGWDAVSQQGQLMAEMVSDGRPNRYGVLPVAIDCGPPHPDALAAHKAVSALDGWEVGFPEDWDPLGDMNLHVSAHRECVARARQRILTIDRAGRERFRQRPAELVRHHAIMKSAPAWQAKAPVMSFVLGANGKPAWFRKVAMQEGATCFEREVDGFNPKARRPYPDAYKKTLLEPDPMFAAVDRAEYEIWHAALGEVCRTLAGAGLAAHEVTASERPARPWE
ncbi:MAG: hypothetical protein GY873_30190 [Bosea sp.]|uniref:hypothetical protein n=1 Tax=Bosea sp. (in: a-proteobacteria) TaxID=1871050 RepID=UPI00239A835D|nr:hypothetical protein [Bosea sp. (in: a-proteobacteria)]MCP4738466.1 hypothetical protein [Bosea sp. (in: a-proteobacteria)]